MTAPGPDKDQMLSVSPRSCPGLGLKGCSWWISQLDSSWGWLSLLGFAAFKKFHFLLWDKNKSKNGGEKKHFKRKLPLCNLTSASAAQKPQTWGQTGQDKGSERCDCGCFGGGIELLLNLSARGGFFASSFTRIFFFSSDLWHVECYGISGL